MMQLVRFPGRTRKIEISQEVASNFHFFGTLLLEDSYGAVVASIAKEFESDLEQASLEILRQWVEGRGKQPVTWDTLIKVIREMEYESLAAEIEATLSEEQQWQLYSSASSKRKRSCMIYAICVCDPHTVLLIHVNRLPCEQSH